MFNLQCSMFNSKLSNRQISIGTAFLPRFAVLLDDAVDTALTHRLAVVDMLRREASVLLPQHFHEQQCHRDGNDNHADE